MKKQRRYWQCLFQEILIDEVQDIDAHDLEVFDILLASKIDIRMVPAAGSFNRLEWGNGTGLFAVGIHWNDKAKAMIASRECRHVSPVFTYDGKTGEVQRVLSVAITNTPALPSLADLSRVAGNSSNNARKYCR
jgi:phage I-like protein